jgi:hypothetical protein
MALTTAQMKTCIRLLAEAVKALGEGRQGAAQDLCGEVVALLEAAGEEVQAA